MMENVKKEYEQVELSLTFFKVDVICTSGDGETTPFHDDVDYGFKDIY